jgi:FkbM family methyltransferase
MGAWARFASWQIRCRIQNEVIFPWIGGQCLAVRRGMTGATGNIYVGLHEFTDMMLPLHFLREDDLFLDIGANIGSYTVLAAGVRRATVWAFEPDPQTLQALKRNLKLNGLDDRVVVHEFALGDRDGEVLFTRGLDTVNRVATAEDRTVQAVRVRRLDALIGAYRPSMIKMDVEGYEEAAIRGAKTLLAGDSLKVVELETVTPEIEATFDQHGFRRAYYDPFSRGLTTFPKDIGASNAVYVRDWDFVASRLAAAPAITVLGKSI